MEIVPFGLFSKIVLININEYNQLVTMVTYQRNRWDCIH